MKLTDIFKQQLKFQKSIGGPFSKIVSKNIKEKEILSDLYVLSAIDELVEFRNCYNKKAWVKQRFQVNREELTFELIDIYLFLINLSLLWDIDANKLIEYLDTKQKKNIKRLQHPKYIEK